MSEVSSVSGPTSGLQVSDSGQLTFNGSPTNILQAVMLIQVGFASEMQGIATDRAQDAQDRLDEIKKVRGYVAAFKADKQYAADEKGDWKGCVHMNDEARQYMVDHGMDVSYVDNDNYVWGDEDMMEVNIQTMQSHLDDLTSQNDLEMVKLKNTLNQQNESLQAANKFASDAYNLSMGIINKS